MSGWICVNTDFDGDETAHFGPRKETGTSLYQVDTLATISSQEKNRSKQLKVVSSVLGDFGCLAICKDLSIFKDFQFAFTLSFDDVVDAVGWSPNGSLLVVGTKDGKIYLVETETYQILFTFAIFPEASITNGAAFRRILFQEKHNEELVCDVFFLSTDGLVCIMKNLDLSIFTEGPENMGARLKNQMKLEKIETNKYHTISTTEIISYKDHFYTFGKGDCIICKWSFEGDEVRLINEEGSIYGDDTGIILAKLSSDGKHLFTVNEDKILTMWNTQIFVIARIWHDIVIMDFQLLETSEIKNNGTEGMKLVILTKDTNSSILSVQELPSLNTVYTLQLNEFTYIANCNPYQESLYVAEGCCEESNPSTIETIRYRCLTEARPETRLSRLLNKKLFEQAEEFAKKFNLDVELVYAVKVNDILDQVASWNSGNHSTESINNMIEDLWRCLDLITDDLQIAESCMKAALPTYHETNKLLQYCKTRLIKLASTKPSPETAQRQQNLLTEVLEISHRFLTYRIIYGIDEYSASDWDIFMNANLLKKSINALSRGQQHIAITLWKRHKTEWNKMMNMKVIQQLLRTIPVEIYANELIDWFKDDLIPYISTTIPLAMKLVVNWILDKITNMELSEKKGWPLNALQFGQTLYKKISEVLQINLTDSVSPADNAAKTEINVKYDVQPLGTMVIDLQNLYNLEIKNSCRLSLAQFQQETTESISFRMLDQIKAVELIVPALQRQIIPYLEEHDLNVDYILSRYVKDLVERCGHIRPTLGTSLWESKTEAIIGVIKDNREKCLAILDIMRIAPLPWTEDTENMIQSGLKLNHPMVVELKEQCRLVEVKKLMYKYGLKNMEVPSQDKAAHLIKYMLKRDLPTAVEDAIKVSDALELTCKVELYKVRALFLIEENRISDYVELLRSLPSDLATSTGQHIVNYTLLLEDTKLEYFEVSRQKKKSFTEAAVATATYLQTLVHDAMEIDEWKNLQKIFHNILALQCEYGEYMTVEQYKDESYREDVIFISHAVKFFTASSSTDNNKKAVNYFEIYRLADLLMIPRVKFQSRLAVYAANKGDISTAVNLCNKLFDCDPSPVKEEAIFQVCQAFIKLLSDCDMELDEIRTLPEIAYQLASQALTECSQDRLCEYLELSKSTQLLTSISNECEATGLTPINNRNTRKPSVSTSGKSKDDRYKTWTFDTSFKEDSLVMNSAIVLPLVANFLKTNPFLKIESVEQGDSMLESCFNASILLIQHLKGNSHFELTFRIVMYIISMEMQLLDMSFLEIKDELAALMKKIEKIEQKSFPLIKELLFGILAKLFNCTKVDHKFGFACFLTLPNKVCMETMKKMMSSAGLNYKKLMAIATVGIGVGEIYDDPATIQTCQQLETNGTWGYRLGKFKIPFKDAFTGGSTEKLKVITQFAQSGVADVDTIKQFCKAFNLERDDGLYVYLENVLTKDNWDVEDTKKLRTRLSKASEIIEAVKEKGTLRKKLKQILLKTSVYDYESLEFILTELNRFDADPHTQQGLELLHYLKVYKRRGTPSEEELKYDSDNDRLELSTVLGALPAIGKTRMPYHLLMGEKLWKIITPELDSSSVKMWIPIAHVLKLKVDEIYLIAAQNMVMKHVACQKSEVKQTDSASADKSKCNWNFDERDIRFLESIEALLSNVSDINLVLACSSWLVKHLPMGGEKILGLKCCVKFAEKSKLMCKDDHQQRKKAEQAYIKFSTVLKKLSTQRVLFYHNITDPEILKLSTQPSELINKLYELPCVTADALDVSIEKHDVNTMVKEIVEIHGLNLRNICMSLIEKWLPSSASKQNEDATCTFSFNSFKLSDQPVEMDDDDANLKRVMYILQKDAVKENALYLYNFAESNNSTITNLCKARALLCLLRIVDERTIKDTWSVTIQEVRHKLRIRSYLVDLSELHIQHSASTFEECNKEGLVRGIWKNHNHQKTGILLVCALCLDYNINSPQLWDGILKQLFLLSNLKNLEYVLVRLSAVGNVWSLPYYTKAWQHLLSSSLSQVSAPLDDSQIEECLHYFNLLYQCPVTCNLNLQQLAQQYENLDLDICAAACLLMSPDSDRDCVNGILKGSNRDYLEKLETLTKLGMTSIAVTQVREAVFAMILEDDDYVAVIDSPSEKSFFVYVIKNDQINGLLEFALSNERYKFALLV
ncbi:hypothetical protein SNE40_010211 [Patella caerulea]|uniref:Kinetochore-associated protein 1 n=1 Tax=Patella caerulea TaxID=87958 RepID=A0AAN8JSX2_PATCE